MIRHYLLTTDDAARWRAVLPADVSVTGSVEYAKICESQTGCAARLFVVEAEGSVVAYPYFLRPVRALPFAADLAETSWDTFTPEYTGPLGLGPGPLHGLDGLRFTELFARHCREQRVVAEFAHLNPWHVPAELLDTSCVEANRDIVYVDLTWDEEQVWHKSLTSAGRRPTKQALRAGVRVRRADSAADVREFHRLYTLTMKRRQALDRYYFSLEYFLEFFETMSENAFYVLAEYQDQVVAGGLYLQDRTDVYWHLSAADLEFTHVRPVNAYVYETIRQALRQGRKRMILGGGYQPDDGVFRFKANFSPLRARFSTYKRIHDAETYAALVQAWSAHHGGCLPPADFFPAYRSACSGDEGTRLKSPAQLCAGSVDCADRTANDALDSGNQ
jgi:hypothetical protein